VAKTGWRRFRQKIIQGDSHGNGGLTAHWEKKGGEKNLRGRGRGWGGNNGNCQGEGELREGSWKTKKREQLGGRIHNTL